MLQEQPTQRQKDNKIIKSKEELKQGDEISIRLVDGQVSAQIK